MSGSSWIVQGLLTLLSLTAAGLGIALWWWALRRGEPRFRDWVALRCRVTIDRTRRGHWSVTAPDRSLPERLGIELLQIAFFLGAMLVWCVGMGVAVGALHLVTSWFGLDR